MASSPNSPISGTISLIFMIEGTGVPPQDLPRSLGIAHTTPKPASQSNAGWRQGVRSVLWFGYGLRVFPISSHVESLVLSVGPFYEVELSRKSGYCPQKGLTWDFC